MKTLILVRHAKASPHNKLFNDFDRPLTPEGLNRTKSIIKWISATDDIPQLIITSPAIRAKETAKLFAKHLKKNKIKLIAEETLYNFNEDVTPYLKVLEKLPQTLDSVMLVGHNPAISFFAYTLLKTSPFYLPTSGTIGFKLHTSEWSKINLKKIELKYFITPGMLNDE